MTSDTSATAAAARASWNEMEEFDLLDKYLSAGNDRLLATDKGLKPKAWNNLMADLNAKHHRTLDKGQYKSKYTRLMQDYDLYKYITNLSGAGVCPETGKPTLDDDVWEQLMTSKPKQRSKIAAIREHGFPHATVCCLIAGDTRATGSHAATVAALATTLCQQENDSDNESKNDDGISPLPVSNSSATAPPCPSSDLEEPASSTKTPSSHQQRVDRVKRIRGGALKSNRMQKKKKSDADITKALTSLMWTTNAT